MTTEIKEQINNAGNTIIGFMLIILVVVIIIGIISITIIILKNKKKSNDDQEPQDEHLPYQICKKLLTDKELKFYNSLKPITDDLGYTLMCKVRLADLVEIPEGTSKYMKWFNAVKAKHIDFVICSFDTTPLFAVEVDDRTHDRSDRQDRDDFVNRIFEDKSVKLLRYRTWTSEQLRQDISPKEINQET